MLLELTLLLIEYLIMGRAYSTTVAVTEFNSALSYLCDEFSKNIFDFQQEAEYGMEHYVPEEQCKKIAKQNIETQINKI